MADQSVQTYSPITDELAAKWQKEYPDHWRAKFDGTPPESWAILERLLAERQHLLGLLEPFSRCVPELDSSADVIDCDELKVEWYGTIHATVADLRAAAKAIRERSGQGIVASGPEKSEPLA
jgi:hypothetical protein